MKAHSIEHSRVCIIGRVIGNWYNHYITLRLYAHRGWLFWMTTLNDLQTSFYDAANIRQFIKAGLSIPEEHQSVFTYQNPKDHKFDTKLLIQIRNFNIELQ